MRTASDPIDALCKGEAGVRRAQVDRPSDHLLKGSLAAWQVNRTPLGTYSFQIISVLQQFGTWRKRFLVLLNTKSL